MDYYKVRFLIVLSFPLFLWNCSDGSNGNSSDESRSGFSDQTPFAFIQRSIDSGAQLKVKSFKSLSLNPAHTPADINSPYIYNPGASLFVRSGLVADALETEVLRNYFQSSDFDVKDLNVSNDGRYLIFAAHGPKNNPKHNSWNIYEYDFQTSSMRRIIEDDVLANRGMDTGPAYALNGSIVFSSSRAAGTVDGREEEAVLAEKGCYKVGAKEKPSLLHTMTREGKDILQITIGFNHDTKAVTLKDGRIAFLRWSRSYELLSNCQAVESAMSLAGSASFPNFPGTDNQKYPKGLESPLLWSDAKKCAYSQATPLGPVFASNHYTLLRTNVDGTEMHQLYNTVVTSNSDEDFVRVGKIMQGENGQLLALLQHEYNQFSGGGLVQLEAPDSVGRHGNTIFANLAPSPITADTVSLYPGQMSENGWYSALSTYRDGSDRVLVSWSQCTVNENGVDSFCANNESASKMDARYGIWVYDPVTDTRLPVVRARRDVVFSDLAVGYKNEVDDFPFSPVNFNYVSEADKGSIICNDPSPPPVDPVDPPVDPVDPPVDPVDPPVDPVDPPVDPVDPPVDPVDPPVDPVDPPVDPVDPPVDPVDPPVDPVDPPVDPVDPPVDPVDPPVDPVDPPVDPVDPPVDPVDPPVDPVDPPVDPVDPPVDPVDPPVDPVDPPVPENEKYGFVHIHSIYDLDGMDKTDEGIAAYRVPADHNMDERKERFIRVITKKERDSDDSDDSRYEESEEECEDDDDEEEEEEGCNPHVKIIGYAEIHPDGSAYFAVPKNTNFTLQFVNKFAKEIVYNGSERNSYLQEHPTPMRVSGGQKLECHGCHLSNSGVQHRDVANASVPANMGASVAGAHFENTNSSIKAKHVGDTMAEAYAYSLGLPIAVADILYTDVWSLPESQTKADDISYSYRLLNSSAPETESCLVEWTENCRADIGYNKHIQPLWDVPGRDSAKNSCADCHNGDGVSTLDLKAFSNGDSKIVYNELFKIRGRYVFLLNDFEQVSARKCKNYALSPFLNNPENNCDVCYGYQLMSKDGAFESATFFGLFDADGDDDAWYFSPSRNNTVNHEGMLSGAERKMISEWLDVSAEIE